MHSTRNDVLQKSRNNFSMVHRNNLLTTKSCCIATANCMLVLKLCDVACFTVAFGEINACVVRCFNKKIELLTFLIAHRRDLFLWVLMFFNLSDKLKPTLLNVARRFLLLSYTSRYTDFLTLSDFKSFSHLSPDP